MREALKNRPLRLIFIANLVSMVGSGMNSAAVIWYVLQRTHSEMSLSSLLVLQTLPAMFLLPFIGVVIDREDRRHLLMWLDVIRAVAILAVALVALYSPHHLRLWHLYVMNALVAAAFWMFWATITALLQELTTSGDFVQSNTLLLAGLQGGWLMAGAVVGFVYDHIGLGGILLIDFVTYLVSLACYFGVRRGRHVVRKDISGVPAGAFARYFHELRDGLGYLRAQPYLVLLGLSWALFLGAMLTQGVVTAPLSDRILHGGAVAYGWMNGAWGVGAFLSTFYTAIVIRRLHSRRAVGISMALLAASLFALPFSGYIAIAALIYFVMGQARGVGGVALSSTLMEIVPKHLMGRVQNTFYLAGTWLQILLTLIVGALSHRVSLTLGFAGIGVAYLAACLAALWPSAHPVPLAETQAVAE